MATAERSVVLDCAPEAALQVCAAALTQAGFKNVTANAGAGLLTAQKRAFGQWTKAQVTLLVKAEGSGSIVTAVSRAGAQSISSLVSDPAERLVGSALDAIEDR